MNYQSLLNKRLLYFAIFVSPLGAGVISIPIGSVQMSLFRMTIIVSLVFMLIKNKGLVVLVRGSNRYSVVFMLLWLFYALISIAWAINIGYWVKAVFFIFIGVSSMFLFNNSFISTKDIEGALYALNFGILIQSLIGWYEIVTQEYLFIDKTETWQMYYNAGFYREPVAMQGNSNDFGLLMFIGFFVAIACFRIVKMKFSRYLSLGLIINYGILTVFSGSRACIIGLTIGIGLFLFLQGFKKSLIIITPFLVLLVFPNIISSVVDTLHFHFSIIGSSDDLRLGLLKTGIDYCLQTFGFGVGAGQIEAWIETKGSMFHVGTVTNLHNWWIEILAAYGIVVFIGYIIFYIKLFIFNYRVVNNEVDMNKHYISLSLCCILVGFIIAGVSSSSNINTEYLWIFWSLCIAYQGLDKQVDYPRIV